MMSLKSYEVVVSKRIRIIIENVEVIVQMTYTWQQEMENNMLLKQYLRKQQPRFKLLLLDS